MISDRFLGPCRQITPSSVVTSTLFGDFRAYPPNGDDCGMVHDLLREVRIDNLRAFVKRKYAGNKSAAARAYGCEPQQMNDLLAGRKSFGEKVVRRCVEKMGVPVGYMDTPNADAVFYGGKSERTTALVSELLRFGTPATGESIGRLTEDEADRAWNTYPANLKQQIVETINLARDLQRKRTFVEHVPAPGAELRRSRQERRKGSKRADTEQ